uniref:Protein LURP-one-related 15 n=1 Tax=Quercus lobata TaxID=97700 RepID=A0A7N2M495_QUELO
MAYQPIPAPTPAGTQFTSPVPIVGPQYCASYPVDLAIVKKVLTITDGNFVVTDINGNVIFKVKGALLTLHDRRTLLDAAGNPILTLREKIMSAHDRWKIFRGESVEAKDLIFSVKRSSMIQFKTKLHVFLANNTKEDVCDYRIEGSWSERSCVIYAGESNTVIAQPPSPQPLYCYRLDATISSMKLSLHHLHLLSPLLSLIYFLSERSRRRNLFSKTHSSEASTCFWSVAFLVVPGVHDLLAFFEIPVAMSWRINHDNSSLKSRKCTELLKPHSSALAHTGSSSGHRHRACKEFSAELQHRSQTGSSMILRQTKACFVGRASRQALHSMVFTFCGMHKKQNVQSVLLGKDNFSVTVYPNIDYAFIVALIVILDDINDEAKVDD